MEETRPSRGIIQLHAAQSIEAVNRLLASSNNFRLLNHWQQLQFVVAEYGDLKPIGADVQVSLPHDSKKEGSGTLGQ